MNEQRTWLITIHRDERGQREVLETRTLIIEASDENEARLAALDEMESIEPVGSWYIGQWVPEEPAPVS